MMPTSTSVRPSDKASHSQPARVGQPQVMMPTSTLVRPADTEDIPHYMQQNRNG